jgi:hypothetical protein
MPNVATPAVPVVVVTVTLAVPGIAIRPAGTLAVNRVPLTYVVASAVPFQLTVAPGTKFVPMPLTVRVNAAPPATAE